MGYINMAIKITAEQKIDLPPSILIERMGGQLLGAKYHISSQTDTLIMFNSDPTKVFSSSQSYMMADSGIFEIDVVNNTMALTYYMSYLFEIMLVVGVILLAIYIKHLMILIIALAFVVQIVLKMIELKDAFTDMLIKSND